MESRALSKDTHKEASDKYSLLLQAVDKCQDNDKIIQALSFFFRTHEKKEAPVVSHEQAHLFLRELAKETVNRDFIEYIVSGVWGNSSTEMIKILSS